MLDRPTELLCPTVRELCEPAERLSVRMKQSAGATLAPLLGALFIMAINSFLERGTYIIARLGPDEWLTVGAKGAATSVANALRTDTSLLVSIVNVSERNIAINVTGDRRFDVLAAGCPIELSALPANTAVRTLFGKVEVVLFLLSGAVRIEVWRSLAPYVLDLLDASILEQEGEV